MLKCLESVRTQSRLPDEVVVVDASDHDQLSHDLGVLDLGMPITYIKSVPHLTRQRNQGVQASRGDIIFFFDDDVVLEPDYIEQVLRVYEEDKQGIVGGVQGTLTNVGTQTSWKRRLIIQLFLLDGPGDGRMLPSGLQRWVDSAHPRYQHLVEPLPIEVMNGCIQSYRRTVFDDFQFNEDLPGYGTGEDRDFSYRVSRKYRLYYTPLARAEHRSRPLERMGLAAYYYLLARFHVVTFVNTHGHNPLNWLAFGWSILGRAIYLALLYRSGEAVSELLRGYREGVRMHVLISRQR